MISKISLFLWYVYNLIEKEANEHVVIAHCDSPMGRQGTLGAQETFLLRMLGILDIPEEIILLIFRRNYIINK